MASEPDQTYKISLAVPEHDARLVEAALAEYAESDLPPVVCDFDAGGGRRQIDIYFADPALETELLERIGARLTAPLEVQALDARDWVAESQRLRRPVRAGRFFVHGAHDRDAIPSGAIAIEIEAGQAFGTGGHDSTEGCLLAVDRLAAEFRPKNALDLGTGSGILAIAIAQCWDIPVLATDVDPVAVAVAAENIRKAGLSLKKRYPGIRTLTADGLNDEAIRAAGPFDLITANILADPLIGMAPALAAQVRSGGRVILSGLLDWQEESVLAPYTARGLAPADRIAKDHWVTLTLVMA